VIMSNEHTPDRADDVAEENLRRSQGELIIPRSIAEIAEWFRALLGIPNI